MNLTRKKKKKTVYIKPFWLPAIGILTFNFLSPIKVSLTSIGRLTYFLHLDIFLFSSYFVYMNCRLCIGKKIESK